MAADQVGDFLDDGVGEAQPPHEGLGVPAGEEFVAVEGGRLAGPLLLGFGLAYVVEQSGQPQHELGRGGVDRGVEMVEYVEDMDPLLLDSSAGGELG